MLKLEIAGLTITYHNATQLNTKVVRALGVLRAQRERLEAEAKQLRENEKTLQRFLGGAGTSGTPSGSGVSHAN